MAFSLYLSSIADAISQISITGVTVKDKDQLSASWVVLPNVLYPNDEAWITNFELDYQTVMRDADAAVNVGYTLNYRFLGTQVGDIGTFPAAYSDLIDKFVAITNALEAVPAPYSGRVQMQVADISIGPKIDPAGNQFFGIDFALQITELQN